jgi:hypothetical protein
MSRDSQIRDEAKVYFDREDLALTIDLILNGDEHAPLLLAQLFVSLRQAIDSGLHGVTRHAKLSTTQSS